VHPIAGQPAKQEHAGLAQTRHLRQVQDEGPSGPLAGVHEEGHAVVAEASDNPDRREIWRLGHDQTEDHVMSFPGENVTQARTMAVGATWGKNHSTEACWWKCAWGNAILDVGRRIRPGTATAGDGVPPNATGSGRG
jgi:hypothetical protein